MHSQKNRNWNVGIVEEINAGRRVIDQSKRVCRQHSRHCHERDAEEELSRQADQKQHEIHMWREELSSRNLPAPRQVGRAGCQKSPRKNGKGERRRVEKGGLTAIFVPADQLFRRKPERHNDELQIEPVRFEPQEQVDAEDYGERTESENIRVAS